MKVIPRGPGKFWLFVGGKAFVLRVENKFKQAEKEISLIPRWRIVSSLAFSAFAGGLSLAAGAIVPGLIMGALTVFLMWAASR